MWRVTFATPRKVHLLALTSMSLDLESFARLAELNLPQGSKIFSASWCPVMDLFLVAVPLSNRERLTLWRMSGNKVWDVEVGRGDAPREAILNVAWSPNGPSRSSAIYQTGLNEAKVCRSHWFTTRREYPFTLAMTEARFDRWRLERSPETTWMVSGGFTTRPTWNPMD